MSNFKIGEKVVYIGGYSIHPDKISPQKNEIVIVKCFSNNFKGNLIIEGYLYGKKGQLQSFRPQNFRKLDYQFAEDVCAQLIKDAKRETILN